MSSSPSASNQKTLGHSPLLGPVAPTSPIHMGSKPPTFHLPSCEAVETMVGNDQTWRPIQAEDASSQARLTEDASSQARLTEDASSQARLTEDASPQARLTEKKNMFQPVAQTTPSAEVASSVSVNPSPASQTFTSGNVLGGPVVPSPTTAMSMTGEDVGMFHRSMVNMCTQQNIMIQHMQENNANARHQSTQLMQLMHIMSQQNHEGQKQHRDLMTELTKMTTIMCQSLGGQSTASASASSPPPIAHPTGTASSLTELFHLRAPTLTALVHLMIHHWGPATDGTKAFPFVWFIKGKTKENPYVVLTKPAMTMAVQASKTNQVVLKRVDFKQNFKTLQENAENCGIPLVLQRVQGDLYTPEQESKMKQVVCLPLNSVLRIYQATRRIDVLAPGCEEIGDHVNWRPTKTKKLQGYEFMIPGSKVRPSTPKVLFSKLEEKKDGDRGFQWGQPVPFKEVKKEHVQVGIRKIMKTCFGVDVDPHRPVIRISVPASGPWKLVYEGQFAQKSSRVSDSSASSSSVHPSHEVAGEGVVPDPSERLSDDEASSDEEEVPPSGRSQFAQKCPRVIHPSTSSSSVDQGAGCDEAATTTGKGQKRPLKSSTEQESQAQRQKTDEDNGDEMIDVVGEEESADEVDYEEDG